MIQLGTRTISVSRRAAGSYVNGVWVPGAASVLSMEASVQPLSPREAQKLPEGERIKESRKLYLNEELFPNDDATQKSADIVTIDGVQFQVFSCEPWTGLGMLPHYKAVLLKHNAGEL